MSPRAKTILKWMAYPAFYVLCLLLFAYLTFPYERLKDRIIAEFAKTQKPGDPPQRLEIDSIDSYWFTGVELQGVRVITPPTREQLAEHKRAVIKYRADKAREEQAGAKAAAPKSVAKAGKNGGDGKDAKKDTEPKPPKPTVLAIDEVQARARMLPLLVGDVELDFWAAALGGEISGTIPVSSGEVEIELESVELALIPPLKEAVGFPLSGRATGSVQLSAPEGKFDKANGELELTIEDATVFDGKTKIAKLMPLPRARLGTLEMKANAKDGVLTVTSLTAQGLDVEIAGDGRMAIREPFDNSNLDVMVRFKFSDAYRSKDDKTKALLGDPGSKLPPLIEKEAKVKRAKREDGFYAFRVHGLLKNPKFDAASAGKGTGKATLNRGAGGKGKPATKKRPNLRNAFSRPKPRVDDADEGDEAPSAPPGLRLPSSPKPPGAEPSDGDDPGPEPPPAEDTQ